MNLEEYLAGTDPHDASSSLRILSVELRQGKPVICFQAAAQKTYRLQRITDLETRSWSDVATWVSGAVGLAEAEDPGDASAPTQFYRLRL